MESPFPQEVKLPGPGRRRSRLAFRRDVWLTIKLMIDLWNTGFSSDIWDFTHQMIKSLSVTNMVIQPSIDEDLNQSEILCVHLKTKEMGYPTKMVGLKQICGILWPKKSATLRKCFSSAMDFFLTKHNWATIISTWWDMMGYLHYMQHMADWIYIYIYIYI